MLKEMVDLYMAAPASTIIIVVWATFTIGAGLAFLWLFIVDAFVTDFRLEKYRSQREKQFEGSRGNSQQDRDANGNRR